ncbi:MAG TPA: TIGR04076 family protein [Bacillota bacterium]|nr:TIGR04076 family protein [Bacillota bacterium]
MKCKITVIKRLYHKDLCEEYCSLNLPESFTGCPFFKVGQEFIVEGHNQVPANFCAWAWADIQKDVLTMMFGGSFPWTKQKGINITCCTDGLMPVIFKVEKIETNIE